MLARAVVSEWFVLVCASPSAVVCISSDQSSSPNFVHPPTRNSAWDQLDVNKQTHVLFLNLGRTATMPDASEELALAPPLLRLPPAIRHHLYRYLGVASWTGHPYAFDLHCIPTNELGFPLYPC